MGSRTRKVGKYEVGRTLGEGTFAKVKFALNTVTGESCAMKILDKEKILKHKMVDQIKREISVMKLVRHPNVVRLHEVLASKSRIYIVLEFVTGGELFDKIVHEGRLSEDESRRYFQQLIDAVDFCHSKGVYHRDLKPENLLLDSRQNLKISDFGLSALPQQTREDGLLHTTCGTPNYVAPEVLSNRGYDGSMADLWSCGVILYVLMAGYLPFDEADLLTLYRKISQAQFRCPPWFSKEATALIRKILNPNPKARAKAADIRLDSWFAKGYVPVKPYHEEDVDLDDINAVFNDSEQDRVQETDSATVPGKGPEGLNAFELIALSQGLQLGAIFDGRKDFVRRQTRFTSKALPLEVLERIRDVATILGFRVQMGNFMMRLDGPGASKVNRLSIVVQVFEMTPGLYMIDVRKAGGDTLDYHKFYKHVYSRVKDLAWIPETERVLDRSMAAKVVAAPSHPAKVDPMS